MAIKIRVPGRCRSGTLVVVYEMSSRVLMPDDFSDDPCGSVSFALGYSTTELSVLLTLTTLRSWPFEFETLLPLTVRLAGVVFAVPL